MDGLFVGERGGLAQLGGGACRISEGGSGLGGGGRAGALSLFFEVHRGEYGREATASVTNRASRARLVESSRVVERRECRGICTLTCERRGEEIDEFGSRGTGDCVLINRM